MGLGSLAKYGKLQRGAGRGTPEPASNPIMRT